MGSAGHGSAEATAPSGKAAGSEASPEKSATATHLSAPPGALSRPLDVEDEALSTLPSHLERTLRYALEQPAAPR